MNQKLELSPEDRKIIIGLKAEQDKEPNAAEFVRQFLPISASQWSKVVNALDPESKSNYFDEISAEAGRDRLDELAQILADIPRLRAQAERINAEDVFELEAFGLIREAAEEARAKSSPERLIIYTSPTGGGKSMLCYYLSKRCNARVVESRESWKRSYFTFLCDVAKAIGCRLDGETRPAAMEDAIISFSSRQRILLAVDEGEFFGAAAINGLKLLLNKTRLVVVICAIAEAHAKWNKYYPLESAQLDRRTHAIIRVSTIKTKDANYFFPPKQFEDRNAALTRLCEEATRFGAYSFLRRVASKIRKKERIELDEMEKAIKASLREMNRNSSK